MTPQRLRQIAQDRKDAIDATVQRWEIAYNQSHIPSRRPSKIGVRITGNADPDITYSDPTGQAAAILLDELDRVGVEMHNRREDDYQLARRLEDFAPAKHWATGRRCTEEGCARPHRALGLCNAHWMAAKRHQEREAS
jgi:hypothetical protein